MNYLELYEKMYKAGMISNNWRHILALISDEIKDVKDSNEFMKLFIAYFSLIDDGNVYMALDENKFINKLTEKSKSLKVQLKEDNGIDEDAEILDEIVSELINAGRLLGIIAELPIIGTDKLFVVDNNRLFTRKYYNSVIEIQRSVKRLFVNNSMCGSDFDYRSAVKEDFALSHGQNEILEKGIYNNLLVTGGPGTGKTTSVFFLLMTLLMENPEREVYLTAPSGKAADRMKESINKNINYCKTGLESHIQGVIECITSADSYTIHRLLQTNLSDGGFVHNSKNQFGENSIFVIDEASMIDVCLFASLLESIPDNARVFILGDKNQLPSVEVGAVFGELLDEIGEENKVVLTETKRFNTDSEVFVLAESINKGTVLTIGEKDWNDYKNYKLEPEAPAGKCPVFCYSDNSDKQSDMIDSITKKWFDKYYKDLQDSCSDVKNLDKKTLDSIMDEVDLSRILCASNEGIRGVKHINQRIIKDFFKDKTRISGYYPGEILMITKNNTPLNLYNGDSGVAVKFEGDETLYIMFKKSCKFKLDDEKLENRIFKFEDYLFYPARLISRDDISSGFAITIHKSQGSDWNNILVILPKLKGHPLLNRQIVYTAITRTKGNTYILSNQENLEYARDNILLRDTGIEL